VPVSDQPAGGAALRPLPPVRWAGLAHVVIPGTVVWFLAFVVLLFLIPTLRQHDAMVWLWTALAGWLLGFVGLGIYGWQRAAARRGSRGASSMALEETFGSRGSEPAGR
jgi:hypothetical protein